MVATLFLSCCVVSLVRAAADSTCSDAGDNAGGEGAASEGCDAKAGAVAPLRSRASLLDRARTEGCNISESSSSTDTLDCVLHNLYEFNSGYAAESTGKAETYGEVSNAGIRMLLEKLGSNFGASLGPEDAFIDIGSGVGKIAVQVLLTSPVQLSVGVEVVPSRCAEAKEAASSLSSSLGETLSNVEEPSSVLRSGGQELRLLCGDIRKIMEDPAGSLKDFADVTVVFMNSLCFPQDLIRDLQAMILKSSMPGTVVFSSYELVGCLRGLLFAGHVLLRKTRSVPELFYAYVVAPPSGIPPSMLSLTKLAGAAGKFGLAGPSEELRLRRLLEGPRRQRVMRGRSASGLTDKEKQKLVMHRQVGELESMQLCMLCELALHLVLTHESGNGSMQLNWKTAMLGDLQHEVQEGVLRDNEGNTLFDHALDVRSEALLLWLMQAEVPPGPLTTNSVGQNLCHREAGSRYASYRPSRLGGLLSELGGGPQSKVPFGTLVPLLSQKLQVPCETKDSNGQTPLHLAAGHGHGRAVESLLNISEVAAAPSVVDAEGITPLHLASNGDVCRMLLHARADVHAQSLTDGRTPLQTHVSKVTRLIQDLSLADEGGIFDALVAYRANVDVTEPDGRTQLHVAAAAHFANEPPDRKANLLLRLLQLRASPVARDVSGRTPLHVASTKEAVQALLDFRADVGALDNVQATPLHLATTGSAAEALIEAGAQLEAMDLAGATPLLRAVSRYDNHLLLRTLLAARARTDAKDSLGRTPASESAALRRLLAQ